ncbi:hypothetical protein FHT40_005365 [Mycolicibacterium sp. BK556]|uniref:DUF1942 domain-containing protein n=1 Tax=unclassified Mycolicibacterium TaxID=2636767 RepID=UPI001614639E|nr:MULTISPECIES: DUF1942 domain-containing protein [unclassified Mycolicibacterium]MBB3605678.1 hypothetical protein [Mycolicibacterium sp. BK556]MBB3635825.1 hypothetical protein [Mycolicibacterium sp. BK607]
MRGTRSSTVLLGMIAVALVVAGCGGSGSNTRQPAAPATSTASAKQAVPFGTAVDIASDGGTATYTVDNLAPVPRNAQIVPAKGTMFAVDVTIVAKSGTVAYNGFWFVARTADGGNVAPAVGAVQPGITSGQLQQGQQVAAHLAYDVPQGKTITGIMFRDPKGKLLSVWAA